MFTLQISEWKIKDGAGRSLPVLPESQFNNYLFCGVKSTNLYRGLYQRTRIFDVIKDSDMNTHEVNPHNKLQPYLANRCAVLCCLSELYKVVVTMKVLYDLAQNFQQLLVSLRNIIEKMKRIFSRKFS